MNIKCNQTEQDAGLIFKTIFLDFLHAQKINLKNKKNN
jgi:hypothetical protein